MKCKCCTRCAKVKGKSWNGLREGGFYSVTQNVNDGVENEIANKLCSSSTRLVARSLAVSLYMNA